MKNIPAWDGNNLSVIGRLLRFALLKKKMGAGKIVVDSKFYDLPLLYKYKSE